MKRRYYLVYWILFVPLFFLLLGFVHRENQAGLCRDFVVEMHYPGTDYMLTAGEVKQMVLNKFDTLRGRPLHSIPVSAIEQAIELNSFVENAEVYVTINGVCVAEVYERKAIISLLDAVGNSVYVDINGTIMPDEASSPPRVPVGSGQFSLRKFYQDTVVRHIHQLEITQLDDMFEIAKVVASDKVLSNMVEQIYLNTEGAYELITKMGRHSVLLGDARNLEEKFFRLKVFYENAIPRGGWKRYRQINLKFQNQVVCKY